MESPLEPLRPQDDETLFLERARGVGKDFASNPTIESICRRLDGLPLAIELAAARTKLLSLGGDPEVCSINPRPQSPVASATPPNVNRHSGRLIEWSNDLLDTEGKRLYARLSGSFPLGNPQEVCEKKGDTVGALVDLSLLKPIAKTVSLCWKRSGSTSRPSSSRPQARSMKPRRRHAARIFLDRRRVSCASRGGGNRMRGAPGSRSRRPPRSARVARCQRPGCSN